MLSDCAFLQLVPGYQRSFISILPPFLKGGTVRNELLAMARASHAFVVVSKSLNQCACRTWREEPAANWRNYQVSNQRVGIGDRLRNIR